MITFNPKRFFQVLLLLGAVFPSCLASSWFSSSSSNDAKEDETNEWVSPIINRELETSVVAHGWPFTEHNVVCEAFGYFQGDKNKYWAFVEDWAASMQATSPSLTNPSEVTNKVLEVAQLQSLMSDSLLLSYGLSLRAYSPLCELHRQLARQLLLTQGGAASIDAMVQVLLADGTTQLLLDPSQLDSLGPETFGSVDLLPGEVPFGSSNNETPVVVLYANLASPVWVDYYRALVALDGKITFVVRHLGNVKYEEEGGTPTVLQGYGVRLDIRNVEYRVFDDRSDGNEKVQELINVTEIDTLVKDQFLAGVNLSAFEASDKETQLKLQAQLWSLHEAQQVQSQRIPPTWQRRQLPLQATTAILSGQDALWTLQDVSQNLPSLASTLVHLEIDEKTKTWAEAMQSLLSRGGGGTLLYVNGRPVPIDRPSFNVFELYELIKEEQTALENLQQQLEGLSSEALSAVQTAWSMGPDALAGETGSGSSGAASKVIRVDVGRGGKKAILYLNDIEKDAQYASWPRQLQQVFMAMQFGAPPTVRRNMFTILAVMDPLVTKDTNAGILLGTQLMQSQFPVRMGVLIVNEQDLDTCIERITSDEAFSDESVACPVAPLFSKPPKSLDDLEALPATTQAIHKLLTSVCKAHVGDGVCSAYMEYLVPTLEQTMEELGDLPLTMKDLVSAHASLMNAMQVSSESQASKEGFRMLTEADTGDEASSYGDALRFALNKAIVPGMSFINGRPLPSASDEGGQEKIGQVFMEEQQHIMQMIMEGEITDNGKSIYAKLLTGDKVFKRLHPLLSDDGRSKDSYVSLSHGFGSGSLLLPESQSLLIAPEAVFVVEAVLDLESTRGREMARSFMSSMDSFPSMIGDDNDSTSVSLAYRVLPSTDSVTSKALCAILANAGSVGSSGIASLWELDLSGKTLENMLSELKGVSSNTREKIISTASESCALLTYLDALPSANFVAANGRVFSLADAQVKKDDLELLFTMELKRAAAVTKLLSPYVDFQGTAYFGVIGRASTFLATSASTDKTQRSGFRLDADMLENDMDIAENPLHFSWNEQSPGGELKVKITAVADPVSEPTQRMAPLLRALRDHLKLPLELVLAPSLSMDGGDNIPLTSYYRFVAEPNASPDINPPKAVFTNLPTNHLLTLRMDVPEPWNVQQTRAVQDTDNLRCDVQSGCSDDAHSGISGDVVTTEDRRDLTLVEYGLKSLMVFGQCYDGSQGSPPNGLQLTLSEKQIASQPAAEASQAEVEADGSIRVAEGHSEATSSESHYSDTLVMKNVGYWQLRANPGIWDLNIAKGSRGAELFDMVEGGVVGRKLKILGPAKNNATKTIVMKDFVNRGELLVLKRRPGYEKATLFYKSSEEKAKDDEEVIHVFSLATGHLYERFLKIMMLSVTKRTSSKVKFWLFENFLSPTFKASAIAMAKRIGCEVAFVTYKWPEWVRGQSEKQRVIWGYKILFLDVLFPLNVKKIIYVDADQVVRGDLKELWDMDLQGAPYGYTPMCSSRETTLGFQFWRSGFWKNHLGDKPYHISALYVVDLEKFRQDLVGDKLRSMYQQLSADPNSLANLDQDLPNYAQNMVPIFSLPQEWLWCESWCSDETKATAKTIDLCNNPLHKEPKVSMAKRIISGELFPESWVELDAEVESYDKEYFASLPSEQ